MPDPKRLTLVLLTLLAALLLASVMIHAVDTENQSKARARQTCIELGGVWVGSTCAWAR